MKKLFILLAIFLVICASAFSGASAAEKKISARTLNFMEPDPPNSIRVMVDGFWYLVILDSNGNPVEIIKVPIRE